MITRVLIISHLIIETGKSAEFQINLLNLEMESLGIPDTDYPSYIKMSSGEFVRICKDLTSLTEVVRIDVKDRFSTFSYQGKSGCGKINLKKNNADREEDQIDIHADEDITAGFGLQYLNSFAKASSLSSTVTLNISNKFPLKIEYVIDGLGYMNFYLAPKMDDAEN